MQDQLLYEYALIRVVPRVEREEFMNVGVILFCAKKKYLHAHYLINNDRLLALCPDLDLAMLDDHLKALTQICTGNKESGPIGQLDLPSRFRWLTAKRSTIIQSSMVHPGFSANLENTFNKLFNTMVI